MTDYTTESPTALSYSTETPPSGDPVDYNLLLVKWRDVWVFSEGERPDQAGISLGSDDETYHVDEGPIPRGITVTYDDETSNVVLES